MKLLKITTCYPEYLDSFYASRPKLKDLQFGAQKAEVDYDAFGWSDYWSHALAPLGYEVLEVAWNALAMQRAWAREHNLSDINPMSIAIAQAKTFQPDVLWFDDPTEELLLAIRREVPSIRLVLGWVGSAIPRTSAWRYMDVVLSCAQESVERLRQQGLVAEQLHHGFDPRVNERLVQREQSIGLTFVGQLVRSQQFHLVRERMLEDIARDVGITIFSPSAGYGLHEELKFLLKLGGYAVAKMLMAAGIPAEALGNVPVLRGGVAMPSAPMRPVNPLLKKFMKPPVFGLAMFQVLRDSRMTLNIHADSSPRFASNMRLFEITGVGSCMVTDWKDNIATLFEPDSEVITYRSAEECIEKVKWLHDHPEERAAIAHAGQQRTLRSHTFAARAEELDALIRKITR